MAEHAADWEPQVWKGALAGAIAGLAASWLMTRFGVALRVPGAAHRETARPHDTTHFPAAAPSASSQTGGPSEKTTNKEAMVRVSISDVARRETEDGSALAHYAFGIGAGAVYGILRETEHAPGGAEFGAELWAIADHFGLPMADLSRWPFAGDPAEAHLREVAAHVLYGLTTAGVYSLVRRAL
jgi:putative membrane protein